MYSLPDYKEKDQRLVLEFMKSHPFATLIGCANGIPSATQVPLLITEKDGKLVLQGHLMKGTDHYKTFVQNSVALCLFTSENAYVSASLYNNPHSGSTWNYMSVQARGSLQFTSEEELVTILQKTTDHFENNATSPAAFSTIPDDYIKRLVKAIAGFTIEVQTLDHVFKLSQDKKKEEYKNVMQHLETSEKGSKELAAEMQKRTGSLFT